MLNAKFCLAKQLYCSASTHSTHFTRSQIYNKYNSVELALVKSQLYLKISALFLQQVQLMTQNLQLVAFATEQTQNLQQQSDKAHCCHQKQRAHNHDTTGSSASAGSVTKNFGTLAAGKGWVVGIAAVRCSVVTHHIRKVFSFPYQQLLKNNSDKSKV